MDTLTQLRAGQLAGARHLHLSCGLTEFPREIFDLADTLEMLDLSGNALTDLPDDFDRLHGLRIVFLSFNAFTHIPKVLGRLTHLKMLGMKGNVIAHVDGSALASSLQWLTLTDNRIVSLPAEIGRCVGLRKLLLAGNRLTALPDALLDCRELELLRLSANRFQALPDGVLALPRLAWLALAGNPFCAHEEAIGRANDVPVHVDWHDLTVHEALGEGASGVIYRGSWQRGAAAAEPVAIKLFKGAMTSDGLPQNEMAACIAGAGHPNLIPVHARIDQHPDNAQGLVLGLIDPSLRNLAAPPSLESCTRDVYASDQTLSVGAAIRLACGIADAARHLHARGIMHGDLYGHNILYAADGQAYLGDFGAASFYPRTSTRYEAIEVRAFGLLLEELSVLAQVGATRDVGLVTNASSNDVQSEWPTALTTLQRDCVLPQGAQRPSFATIGSVLSAAYSTLTCA